MNFKLWSSHHMAKEAALARRSGEVCLDNAFVLIDGAVLLVEEKLRHDGGEAGGREPAAQTYA